MEVKKGVEAPHLEHVDEVVIEVEVGDYVCSLHLRKNLLSIELSNLDLEHAKHALLLRLFDGLEDPQDLVAFLEI